MKRFILYSCLLLGAIGFGACEKIIEVELRSVPPMLVIEAAICEGETAHVRLSHTLDFYDQSGYPILTDALVQLSDDRGNTEMLQPGEDRLFHGSSLIGTVGTTYTLRVVYDEKEYTSVSKMPPRVLIDSLTLYQIKFMDYPFPMLHYTDPSGEENQYYRYRMYVNDSIYNSDDEFVSSTELFDGSVIHQVIPVMSRDDEADALKPGDVVKIELHCLDEGAYNFFSTLGGVDMSQVNPTSNIQGGALGYFMAYIFDQQEIIADWDP